MLQVAAITADIAYGCMDVDDADMECSAAHGLQQGASGMWTLDTWQNQAQSFQEDAMESQHHIADPAQE